MRLDLLIAARYIRSPKSHSVINIISVVSVVAMAVPVAAIILLLSIFNGLEQMTSELYQAIDADLRLTPKQGTTLHLSQLDTALIRKTDGVAHLSLMLEQSALAEANQCQTLVSVKGVDENYCNVVTIKDKMQSGLFTTSFDGNGCIVAAHGAAHDLGLLRHNSIGEQISLYTINRKRFSSILPVGGFSRCDMPMTGIVVIDQQSSHYLFTDLKTAQKLFSYPDQVSSIELKLEPEANAERVKQQINEVCGSVAEVKTRYESNSIYRLMALEKWGVFIIAMVVMAVASLSIVGTLVMVVIDKRNDIETLRTMGASHSMIESIFRSEGYLMALLSLVIGVALGVGLALVQQTLGLVRLNTETLMIDAYPVELHLVDVVLTIVAYASIAWLIIRFTVRGTLSKK